MPYKMLKIASSIIMILFFNFEAFSQNIQNNISVSPSITIGYTLFAGWNYGFELDFGLFSLQRQNGIIHTGISYKYYFVNVKKMRHRIQTFDITLENENVRLSLGAGDILRKWGLKNINKSKAFGAHVEMDFYTFTPITPWLGVRIFSPKYDQWDWFNHPFYFSGVAFYKPEPYYPWGNKTEN